MSALQTRDWRPMLQMAYGAAQRSPDPSTQNGAILVRADDLAVFAIEYNRPPNGVPMSPERWERPLKYKWVEHAERNALFALARSGAYSTQGLTMVCPWAACTDCARAIIQCGIRALVTHRQAHDRSPDFWKSEIDIAFAMFQEAGVEVIMYDGVVGASSILHSGKLWNP